MSGEHLKRVKKIKRFFCPRCDDYDVKAVSDDSTRYIHYYTYRYVTLRWYIMSVLHFTTASFLVYRSGGKKINYKHRGAIQHTNVQHQNPIILSIRISPAGQKIKHIFFSFKHITIIAQNKITCRKEGQSYES